MIMPATTIPSNIQDQDLRQTVAVIAQATEANERQIREVARTSAENFKDISALIERTNSQTNIKLENLATSFQASQKPNVMAWIAAMAVFVTMITGAMWIISLNTENTVFKNVMPIQAAMDANTAGDKVSITERANNAAAIAEQRTQLADIKARQQVFQADLREVETQFRAKDQANNVQFAEQQRMNNILMQLTKSGITYPSAPYFFPLTTGMPPQ